MRNQLGKQFEPLGVQLDVKEADPREVAARTGKTGEEADHRHRFLLRAGGARPGNDAAETEDQIATVHSITSSARARSVCGTVRPRALAVFILMTNSNVVGCCTGRSAGLAPLRIFPA